MDRPGPTPDPRPGRWGLTLLAVTAVAGIALAAHGWSSRDSAQPPGSFAAGSRAAPASTPRHPAAPARGAGQPAGPSPHATPSTGPLLSSEPYASAAFQVWPGPPSAAAQTAMTGLRISVHQERAGLLVAAGVAGQAPSARHVYSSGARVYVVEYTLGDDSGNTDYSLGDDGVVVTDAHGRIVQ